MMKIQSLLIILLVILSHKSYADLNTFVGFNKQLKDVQNSKGKVEGTHYSPVVGLGYNIRLTESFGCSPQLGYIHTTVTAKDSYGKQKVHSIFLNYDFIYLTPFMDNLALRFGIGNFIKRTSGKGGNVTIPNGNSTTTAKRPGKTVSSYSSTFNLGADLLFNFSTDWFRNMGLRFELYTFRPLSKEYRNYAFNLGFTLYF